MTKAAKPAPSHRDRLRKAQNGKCCYCGIKMRRTQGGKQFPDSETVEHLRRKADGGDNSLGNKALACYRCNVERGEIDWMTYKSFRMGEIYLSAFSTRDSVELPTQRIAA